MRSLLVTVCIIALCSPWVIYRRNHKRKLICREDTASTNNSILDEIFEDVPMNFSRRRRDIKLDPVHMEPIIFLDTKSNSSNYVDDGDFDIVAENLTSEEIAVVKRRIVDTCNALRSV